jgi:hypothetical protein
MTTIEEWKEMATRGTSGDQVWDLIASWEEDRKVLLDKISTNNFVEEQHVEPPKYPHIHMLMQNFDFGMLLQSVLAKMHALNINPKEIRAFNIEALSAKDSREFAAVCRKWVTIDE